MIPIRKAVIPVAGFGTRFLPATKASPKEMLPVIDKPVVQYVVEEAVASGITDIVFVTGGGKRAIEDHFDYNFELQAWLKKQGKDVVRSEIKRIADMANFTYVRQKGPYGNGTPVLCAQHVLGNEPFALLWGDEFFMCPGKPRLAQLLEVYEKYQAPVLTAYTVPSSDAHRYGMLEGEHIDATTFKVQSILEKPAAGETTSTLAALGAYILTPDIFQALKETPPGKEGELWLPDAIATLLKTRPVYACKVQGTYYDTGSPLGWLKANIDLALQREDMGKDIREYMREKV